MKSTLLFLFIIPALLITAEGIAFAQDSMSPADTNVTYPGPDGVTLEGYLAVPSGSGRLPAVLMIHEWWGLNRDTALLADALAEEGFVVLAPDAFRGSVAQTPSKARSQISETPQEQIAADLDAALEYLKAHGRSDPDRIASLGFCFGGTQSMYMGTRRPELAAVVIFYGSGPIRDPEELGSMRRAGPVLGIYGEEDGSIPVSSVREFESALDERNVENSILIYEGVGHAFVKSDTYDNGGTAERAWRKMVSFLKDNLM
ncbi:MAG: dienelactone hydrolase family protein [Spirochaetia bacterium]